MFSPVEINVARKQKTRTNGVLAVAVVVAVVGPVYLASKSSKELFAQHFYQRTKKLECCLCLRNEMKKIMGILIKRLMNERTMFNAGDSTRVQVGDLFRNDIFVFLPLNTGISTGKSMVYIVLQVKNRKSTKLYRSRYQFFFELDNCTIINNCPM